MIGNRHLLAVLALFALFVLFATTAVHAAPVDFTPVYDSALGGAVLLAQTDPTRAPEPDSCLLLAAGCGLLGVLVTRRRHKS